MDCEKSVTRLYHWAGCSIVCRLCMRTGPNFPCRVIERIHCNDCGYVFPQRACYEHHLNNNVPENIAGHNTRPFASICQSRRICSLCGKIIFGQQQQHDCILEQQQLQQQLNGELIECNKCHGPHLREQPCYIQPLRTVENSNPEMEEEEEEDASFESEAPLPQQQQQNRNTKRLKQKLRLCFFDAETSQDQPMSIGANNIMGYKHVPLLLIAEVICEKCIVAGIKIGDVGQRELVVSVVNREGSDGKDGVPLLLKMLQTTICQCQTILAIILAECISTVLTMKEKILLINFWTIS
uniref:C2H2-type domain-containing protein n=1 Tax=Meloidogyne hapla TaxID=6305 RepID=A0A1I8BWE1_MELHA